MGTRQELHTLLKTIVPNAYHSPPENVKMAYPCIVYRRDRIRAIFSNNLPGHRFRRYSLTLITQDPDSELVDTIAALPMCVHDRFFTADDLNHDVFNIYF